MYSNGYIYLVQKKGEYAMALMKQLSTPLFISMISLLLIHEMDAIRTKEWRMFIFLKDMKDAPAYRFFLLAHLPLYFIVIFILAYDNNAVTNIFYYVLDFFLIGHALIHWLFRKNPNNGFTSGLSKIIIYLSGILAMVHMVFLSLFFYCNNFFFMIS